MRGIIMGIDIKTEDAKRNILQEIYDDRNMLELIGMININALSNEEKRDISIQKYDIKIRIEKNEKILRDLEK